ncbi:DUF3073 family protein [Nonomuraea basaltis]|uniref:DUF3073 family protein n=1 Tax=Nonomuraea basaltis TaxID=2495887 RepID=UPI00110C61B5|nr:DUF3073 family protein [Nonomuraea basaltis]TMR90149.1 DUF3073 family protein [Nonomuraea basaltis]
MGRGRAKAKQTKVARELKYADHGIDLERLRTELVSDSDADENRRHPSEDEQD